MFTSQEQKSGIFPRSLTTLQGLPMIVESSARRRHGPARDVLRTNVLVAGQPSQRVGWGAIARAGVGLSGGCRRPSRPSCRRPAPLLADWMRTVRSREYESGLTGSPQCATIAFGPRYGMMSDRHMVRQVDSRMSCLNCIEGGGAKTSQEPNGRTREEGSDRGRPPPRGRTSYGVALVCLAP